MQDLIRFGPHFFCAVGLCAILAPVTSWIAHRFGILSVPSGRHAHETATPRIGGLAIAAGFFVTLWLGVASLNLPWLAALQLEAKQPLLLIGAGLFMLAGGLWDDVRPMRPATKFAYQMIAATAAWYGGAQIESAHLPFVGLVEFGWFSLPLTLLWIVGITNALNLLDGLDGLAAGVTSMIAAGMGVVALYFSEGNAVVAFIALTLAGASAGFLIHNWYPARVFMGDCGSNFLGFALACISLIGNRKGVAAVGLAASFLLLGLPVIDMLFSIFRRTMQGRSPFSADRGHLHHLLMHLGLSQRRVVMTLYLATLTLGAIGIVTGLKGGPWVGIGFAAAMVMAAVTYRWFGFRVRNILLRERNWQRAIERTREGVRSLESFGAVWHSLAALSRMMGFGSAELHLYEPDNEEAVAVYRRRNAPPNTSRHLPLCLELGRNKPVRAQLVLCDFRARRSAHLMHRVALMMPVLEEVERNIDRYRIAPRAAGRFQVELSGPVAMAPAGAASTSR